MALIVCASIAGLASSASAGPGLSLDGTIVVDGFCTLGDAIRSANADADLGACTGAGGAETIVLDVDVVLGAADLVHSSERFGDRGALPDITSTMTLEAGLASRIARDPALGCSSDPSNHFRLLHVVGGSLTLRGVELENGCATSHGGAVVVLGAETGQAGRLEASNVTFRGHRVQGPDDQAVADAFGGALYVGAGGTITVAGSLFEANEARGGSGAGVGFAAGSAFGGALFVEGSGSLDSIDDAVFASNRALGGSGDDGMGGGGSGGSGYGGAIASRAALGEISQSLFEGNAAEGGDGDVVAGEARGGALDLDVTPVGDPSQLSPRPTRLHGLILRDNGSFGGSTGTDGSFGGAGVASAAFLRGLPAAPIVLENTRVTGGLSTGGDGDFGGDGRCTVFARRGVAVRRSTFDANVVLGGGGTQAGGGGFGGGACGSDDSRFETVTIDGNQAVGGPSQNGTGGFGVGGGWSTFDLSESRLDGLTITDNWAIAGDGAADGGTRGGGLSTAWFARYRNVLAVGNRTLSASGVATPSDCHRSFVGDSDGFNLIQVPGSCAEILNQPGDQVFVDPALAPFDRNGCVETLPDGQCLPTRALPLGSPAVDAGSCGGTKQVDARGYGRPWDAAAPNVGDGCDVGAFEARDVVGGGTGELSGGP